ncbi:MAG TPA: CHAD domain-containing protein [Steroidobacteraceae bacterium]|nr:CHAD domain-containing protein [Steroidobacteraceae bacterium]
MAGALAFADTPAQVAREALLDQLDKVLGQIAKRRRSDAAIHGVRKELKRARATLRLLREHIGVVEYRRDNALIRDAARPLTPVRDAKVLLDSFKVLAEESPRGRFSRHFRALLEDRRRAAARRLSSAELAAAARVLSSIRRRAASLPGSRLSQTDDGALKRAYKRGREAHASAKRRATDESLHEWRKQTKYFENQLEIVLPFGPKFLRKSHRRAKRLADILGDDHDLALLAEQILLHAKGEYAPSQDSEVEDMIVRVARWRKQLQAQAFRLARRLYSGRARRYQR